MKKVIISISLCLSVGFSSIAQDAEMDVPVLTNKRGMAILPKAGDYALGIEAASFLGYVGNFFANSNSSAPSFTNGDGKYPTIFGKYFLQDDRAIRARVTLGLVSNTTKAFVQDDNKPAEITSTLEDVRKNNAVDINLGLGYEFRRGTGRMQGFYGPEASLGFYTTQDRYEYANSIKTDRWAPSSHNFNENCATSGGITTRKLVNKDGMKFTLGIGGFVGVEYFFTPRLSIGGEFGLMVNFSANGKGKTTQEKWSIDSNSLEEKTIDGPQVRESLKVELITRASKAGIFLMFHF